MQKGYTSNRRIQKWFSYAEGVRHPVHSIRRGSFIPEGVIHRVHSTKRGTPMQKVLDIEYSQLEEDLLC